MAYKAHKPGMSGVNTAHADNLSIESNQDSHPDQILIDAWARRQAAYVVYNALPFNEDLGGDPGEYSPDEREQWDIIDAAEMLLCSTKAKTPRGVILQLLVSLSHSLTDREAEEAINDADLPALYAMEEGFDWADQMALAAIRSLEAMEA